MFYIHNSSLPDPNPRFTVYLKPATTTGLARTAYCAQGAVMNIPEGWKRNSVRGSSQQFIFEELKIVQTHPNIRN